MNETFLCTANDLAIGYGKTPLLSGIALGVQPGQILTLIGPNGAGKSTLLRTLAGQLDPMGGAVLLDEKNLSDYTGTQRAQKLALMAPHSRRMELTTCFDFAAAGRYPYTGRLGILSAEDKRQAHSALERRPAPARSAGPGPVPAAAGDFIGRAHVFSGHQGQDRAADHFKRAGPW